MTILLFTDDPRQGQTLTARLAKRDRSGLCLTFSPAEAVDALREVQADRVVCPAGLIGPLRLAVPVRSMPRFFPWPERVTDEWLRALTQMS